MEETQYMTYCLRIKNNSLLSCTEHSTVQLRLIEENLANTHIHP